jgi:hypothetical protein
MPMRRSHQIAWTAWFLGTISAVPLIQSAAETAEGRLPGFLEIFTAAPTRENLRAFEKRLEDDSLFARAARPWIQYAAFRLFGDAGEKVLAGSEGWLFYRPDVQYLVEASTPPRDPVWTIVQFRDQLAARGIRLMVMPVPGKPSIHAAKLTSRVRDPVRSPTRTLIAGLRAAGVETLDLFELFSRTNGASGYLRRDTHWTPGAAEAAAQYAAARLRQLDWIEQGSTGYIVRPAAVSRISDIARMTRAPLIEASFPAEVVVCRQVIDPSTAGLYRDDPGSPLLVMGDSFLRIYETDEPRAAGFIAHLARSLRRPVASLVNDGGASTLVRQELARRPTLLEGKKAVLWEFVERDLLFGTEGWKPVHLPPAR